MGEFRVVFTLFFVFVWSFTRAMNCFYMKSKALFPEMKASGSLFSCWGGAPPEPLLAHIPAPTPKNVSWPHRGNISHLHPGLAEAEGGNNGRQRHAPWVCAWRSD